MINDFYREARTEIPIDDFPFKLTPSSKTFFIGSCFSNNLYKRMNDFYLNTIIAPFGNIYNPKSIHKCLNRVIDKTLITSDECFISDGLYQHFDFHSSLGKKDINNYIKDINRSIIAAHNFLIEADVIIITLGSAFVYEVEGSVINNCHKLSKDKFTRRVLTIEEIIRDLLSSLKKLNNIDKVFTLSPVRHLRDNPKENSYSKAILRVSIENILKETDGVYFPSYEILLDELRDYRWYDESLTHPNKKATNYIIDSFLESTMDVNLQRYIKRVKKLNKMFNHKILNPESESALLFKKKIEDDLINLKKEYKQLSSLQKL